MVGGGAAFNQLNGFFIVPTPAGDFEINRKIMQGLKNLREFLESFEYIKMTRDKRTVRRLSIGGSLNMISEAGRQYAIYMHHSFPCLSGSWYEPNYGKYAPAISMILEAGSYCVQYIEPASLRVIKEEHVTSDGGEKTIACPEYTLDIAIKIVAE
jgi:hypothetical protein